MNRYILFFLSIWVVLTGAAQVSFTAKAPSTVGVDEQFRVQYVLNNAEGEQFSNPSFPDFECLNGPATSTYSSLQVVNGRSSKSSSVTYTYILRAKKKGTFHLPVATIHANGKVFKSNALTVNVAASTPASRQQAQSSQQSDDDDDFFVQTQPTFSRLSQKDLYFTVGATKRQVYEQEPIMLTYKFHAKVGVGLANVMLRQKPDLKGFWTQEIELPHNLNPTLENGYKVGTNLQYVIFPQQTGKLTIPGITFDCDVIQQQRGLNPIDAFFNGGGGFGSKVQRTTEDLTINVLPLPQPKPTAFSGGVGHFSINNQLLTPEPKTNDIATLRVTISGSGNMKLIKAPFIKFPKDFDSYDAKMTDHTKVSVDGITGEVYFDYTFVPRNIGKYEIPAAEFIYFDTASGQYVTLHTSALHLDVKKGNRSKEDIEAEMALRNSDIRGIHTESSEFFNAPGLCNSSLPHKTAFFGASWGWLGSFGYFNSTGLLLMMLTGLLRLLRKHLALRADVSGTRVRKARKKANKLLRGAENALASNDHRAFYGALAQALRSYFADKLNTDAAAMTNESILSALQERGISKELLQNVKTMLEDIDFARFAPNVEVSQREQDIQRVSDIFNNLDQQLKLK